MKNAHRTCLNKISTCSTGLKAYCAQLDQSINDQRGYIVTEMVYKQGKVNKEQIAVPNSMRSTILIQCHEAPSGGHLCRQKTHAKIKPRFY